MFLLQMLIFFIQIFCQTVSFALLTEKDSIEWKTALIRV